MFKKIKPQLENIYAFYLFNSKSFKVKNLFDSALFNSIFSYQTHVVKDG